MVLVTRGVLREGALVRSNNSLLGHGAPAMDTLLGAYERVVSTSLRLDPRAAPNLNQGPLSWSGKAFVAKHGAHDGSALSETCTQCWG